MALTLLVFIFLAALTFAVVMAFTRPSATDRVIERRLARVQMAGNGDTPVGDGAAEFLKHTNLSEVKCLTNYWNNGVSPTRYLCCYLKLRVPGA